MDENIFIECGLDDNGQPAVLHQHKIQLIHPIPNVPSFSVADFYFVKQLPVTQMTERTVVPYDIDLPENALRFLLCRIPPIEQFIKEINQPDIKTVADYVKYGMHKTPSVDYFYVSKGQVTLYMPSGDSYPLKEGDAYAIRGIPHAWVNFGEGSCDLVGVMLGIKV